MNTLETAAIGAGMRMQRKRPYSLLSFLIFASALSACHPSSTPTVSPTATVTPIPPSSTPTITPSPTATATSIYARLPIIGPSNVADVKEIAHLAKGEITKPPIWLPDGKRFAVATTVGVYIYSVATSEELQYIATATSVDCFAVDPGGHILAICDGPEVRLWNIDKEEEHLILTDDEATPKGLVFNPDQHTLAVQGVIQYWNGDSMGDRVNIVQMWDVNTGEWLYSLMGRELPLFDPTGKLLAVKYNVAFDEQRIEFWDVATGQLFHFIDGDEPIEFNPDGKSIAIENQGSAWDEQIITLWDINSWEVIGEFDGGVNKIWCEVFNREGNLLVTHDERSDTTHFWNLSDHTKSYTFSGNYCPNFSPDGQTFAASGNLWRVTDGTLLQPLGDCWMGRFSSDGQYLLERRYGSDEHQIIVCDGKTGELVSYVKHHLSAAQSLAFHPDGRLLVTGHSGGAVYLWSIDTGQVQDSLRDFSFANKITFSPDGKSLASGDGGGSSADDKTIEVKIWDINSKQATFAWELPTESQSRISAITFSPDGQIFAVLSSGDQAVRIWDLNTSQLLNIFVQVDNPHPAIAFTPDGQAIGIAASKHIRFWDIKSTQLLFEFWAYREYEQVEYLAFTKDGKTLVGASYRTIWVWDADTRELTFTIEDTEDYYIRGLAISPNGKVFASLGGNAIKFWDRYTGELLATIPGHNAIGYILSFSPDGRLLASAGADGTVRLWGVQP